MHNQKRNHVSNFFKITLTGFIVVNAIFGEAIIDMLPKTAVDVESETAEVAENLPEAIRDELNLTGQVPLVWLDQWNALEEQEVDLVVTLSNIAPQEEVPTVEKQELPEVSTPEKTKLESITNNSNTTERIWAIFEYLEENGFTPEAAAGVIGNIAVESCFNPTVVSPSNYYGLFQWNTNASGEYWWYEIESWLSKNGYSWDSFEGQIRAFVECPNKGLLEEGMFEHLKTVRCVEEATEIVCVFYEGCTDANGTGGRTVYYKKGSSYQALDLRKSEAWVAYQMYKNGNEYNGQKSYPGK